MTLRTQLLSLPIVGGLNEKEDSLLSTRPQTMTNCVYRKTGAVSKRHGFEQIGPYNKDLSGYDLPAGEQLATFNGELLRIGGGKLHTYGLTNDEADWHYRDRVPECVVERETLASASAAASIYSSPTVAYAGGFQIAAYSTYDGTTWRIFVDVTEVSTGARVFSRYQLASAASSLEQPKVVATGTTAGVFWRNASGTKIDGTFLSLSLMTWGAVARAVNSVAGSRGWDVDVKSETEYVFAYVLTSGANRLSLQGINRTITAGIFDPTTQITLSTADIVIPAISLRCSAERFWLAYSLTAGGDNKVKVTTLTTSYVAETAPFEVFSISPGGSGSGVGIERTTATTCVVLWTDLNNAGWNEATYTGTISYTTSGRRLRNALWLTRPLVRSGRAYALCANVHSTHATQFLLDLSLAETLPTNGSPRIVSVILPRQLNPITYNFPARDNTLSDWINPATDEYVCASFVEGGNIYSFGIVGLRAKFDTSWTRTTAQTVSLLTIGGGVLSHYDGSQVFENGFAYEPDENLITLTAAVGGSLTTSSTYGYLICYAWYDSAGNLHRSQPSASKSVAMTTNNEVTVVAPCLQLTNKGGTAANADVLIEIYRTAANGSTYYFVTTLKNVCGTATVSFIDQGADSTITSNAAIYTDGAAGSVLVHQIPAGGPNVLTWKGGILAHASDDDSVWISGEIVQSEGPWFHSSLNLQAFEGGKITALAQLDATPIVFKESGAWYLDGEPPSDLGVSSITAPKRIQTEAGCTDAASVVSTPLGVARMASTGLYLLDRSLQDRPIGKHIEDSYRTSGYAGVAMLPAQGLLRWLQRGSGGFDALNYDYYHGQVHGTPVWSKDTYPVAPVAATVWNGDFVWVGTDGFLYREDTTTHLDAGAWVTMTFATGFEKAAGVAAYQRVQRVYVTGERETAHDVTVTLETDVGTESRTWDAGEVDALPFAPISKMIVHVADQKSQWLSVKISDATPSVGAIGTGEGMVLRDISVMLGVKPSGSQRGGQK